MQTASSVVLDHYLGIQSGGATMLSQWSDIILPLTTPLEFSITLVFHRRIQMAFVRNALGDVRSESGSVPHLANRQLV